MLWAVAWAAMPIGILSIDAASTNILMRPLRLLSLKWGMVYDDGGLGFFNRLTTIFDNANVYAGVMSVAVLICFYLTLHAENRKQRIAAGALLLINTVCYVLAISMGSIFFFLLACILYLILAGNGQRLSLFLLMFWDAVCSLAVSFVCMRGLAGDSYTGSPIPLLAIVAGCIVFVGLDIALRDRLTCVLSAHKKTALASAAALLAVCAVFLVVALHWDGPYTLSPGASVSRSANLPAGEYTLTVSADQPVDIVINAKGQREMLTNTATQIASGDSSEIISFTVPEETKGVFVICSLPEDASYDAVIDGISYSGASDGSFMLQYRLLPSFIANRLQELTASGTAAIRTMFFRDGLKLWLNHPVLGAGMASFNNGIYSVQEFFYGTKYVHNHYIQMLCDFGIVGFVIFLAILGCIVRMLWFGRKKYAALAAVLSAVCLQIFGQAMTDVTWSAGAPLLLFFVIFGVICAAFGEAVPLPAKSSRNVSSVLRWASTALAGVCAILLVGNVYGSSKLESGDLTIDEIPTLCVIDSFDRYSFQLTYLVSSLQYADNSAVQAQADKYAASLSTIESATTPIQLAAYYEATGRYEDMLTQIDRSIVFNRSDSGNWSSIFNLYETMLDPVWVDGSSREDAVQLLLSGDDRYLQEALSHYEQMCAVSAEQWDDLTLEPNNISFLGKLLAVSDIPAENSAERLSLFSSMVYDSDYATDVNADGIADFVTGESLTAQDGAILAASDTTLTISAYFKTEGSYELRITTDTPDAFSSASLGDIEMPYSIEGTEIVAGFTLPAQLANQSIDLSFQLKDGASISSISFYRTAE